MTAPSPVLLAAGPPTTRPSLGDLLGPHGFMVEVRPPNGLPDALTGYAALILDGRDGNTEVLALGRRCSRRPSASTSVLPSRPSRIRAA